MTIVTVTLKGFKTDADHQMIEVMEAEQLRFLATKNLEELIEEAFKADLTPVFELSFDQPSGFKLITQSK